MSNSLIPYSFIPGAKAKAQEVNANFISLAEKIEENLKYTTSQIEETVEKINQSSSEIDGKKADKNLGNTGLLTNCILESPNGVVEASENIVTIKSGLKVYIPAGFNEDGSVKNIVYDVTEDTPVTTIKTSDLGCIYISPDGCGYSSYYFSCKNEPYTKSGIWYNEDENLTYIYNADSETWDPIEAIVIAIYENTNGIVSLLKVAKTIRLLTSSDKNVIINWGLPVYLKMTGRSWDKTYTAMRNGYIFLFGVSQTNVPQNFYINNVEFNINWVSSGMTSNAIIFPIKYGDTYGMYGNKVKGGIYFIPMEGEL